MNAIEPQLELRLSLKSRRDWLRDHESVLSRRHFHHNLLKLKEFSPRLEGTNGDCRIGLPLKLTVNVGDRGTSPGHNVIS
jgi:hypothetical protein